METLTIENPDEKDTKKSNELIGGATGRDHFSHFYLDNIWVKEEHRSKGIGKSIHEEIVACVKKCGCKRILLSTLNKKAVRFYLKLGYKQLSVIEEYAVGFSLYYLARIV